MHRIRRKLRFAWIVLLTLLPVSPALAGVELTSFAAMPMGQTILIAWQTGSEVDMQGFYLWRSTDPDGGDRISDLIPATGPGASYQFTDSSPVAGQLYYYRLEAVEQGGASEFFGPVSATVPPVPSDTPSPTPSLTPSGTLSPTPTVSPTPTLTGSPTATRTATPTPSRTWTPTPTRTATPIRTATPWPTFTRFPTNTPRPLPSATPRPAVPTATLPPTLVPTAPLVPTVAPIVTFTASVTPTLVTTPTLAPTAPPTDTPAPSPTATETVPVTAAPSPTMEAAEPANSSGMYLIVGTCGLMSVSAMLVAGGVSAWWIWRRLGR